MALLVGMTALAPLSMQIFVPALPAIQRGFAVPTGHYPAEHRPDLVYEAFSDFFSGREPVPFRGEG